MELELVEKEMLDLQGIVKNVFLVSVLRKDRRQDTVNARMVYSKILRDRGHTLVSIGRSIKKDHSTILNHTSKADFIINHDKTIMEKYMICKELFLKEREPIVKDAKERDLHMTITKLNNKINDLNLEMQTLKAENSKIKRLKRIIDSIDSKTSIGREDFIESKINFMFNDLYGKY